FPVFARSIILPASAWHAGKMILRADSVFHSVAAYLPECGLQAAFGSGLKAALRQWRDSGAGEFASSIKMPALPGRAVLPKLAPCGWIGDGAFQAAGHP